MTKTKKATKTRKTPTTVRKYLVIAKSEMDDTGGQILDVEATNPEGAILAFCDLDCWVPEHHNIFIVIPAKDVDIYQALTNPRFVKIDLKRYEV
jgi:hypothetical protein